MAAPYLAHLRAHNIPPKAVAGALGLSCKRVQGQTETQCPVCAGRMVLTRAGAVCDSPICKFWTGDSLDFAAACMKGSYEGALDLALDLSPNWLTTAQQRNWANLRGDLADTLRRHRAVLDFFIEHPKRPENLERMQAKMSCRKRLIEPECMPRGIYPLTANETEDLFSRANKITPQMVQPRREPHVAFLFFRDLHHLSRVQLLPSSERARTAPITSLKLSAARFSFLGVHDARPTDTLMLGQNFVSAARDNGQVIKNYRRTFKLGMHYDPAAVADHEMPKASCILIDADVEPFLTAVGILLRDESMKVIVRYKETDSAPMAWDVFASEWLVKRLVEDAADRGRWLDWLDSAVFDATIRGKILAALNQVGDEGLERQVRELFRHRAVLTSDKYVLHESQEGYFVRHREGSRDSERSDVTNFTIELTSNLVFRDTNADVYHLGVMHCGSRSYPVRILSTALNSPQELETMLRQTVILGTTGDEFQNILPTIRDRANARLVLDWLKQMTSNLRGVAGISRLGWSSDKKVFQGAGWRVTADGVGAPPSELHPQRLPAIYSMGPLLEAELPKQLPPSVCRVLSRLAASLARGGVGLPLRPTFYSDEVGTRAIMQGIFHGLGQEQPLDLLFGGEGVGQLDNMRSFPVLVAGLNQAQATRIPQPLFILEQGGESVGEEAPEGLAAFAAKITAATLSWVLAGGAAKYKRASAVLYETQLEREGEQVLREALGLSGWPDTPQRFVHLENWLRRRTADELEQSAEMDAQSQLIWLPGDGIDSDVELELRAHAAHVERRDKHVLVDSVSFTSWAENFYGRTLRYRLTNLPVKA